MLKNQQSNNKEQPEMVATECQCDLSTAYFEKCIEEEKCQVQQLKAESSNKDALVESLNLNLQQLKDELNKLQVYYSFNFGFLHHFEIWFYLFFFFLGWSPKSSYFVW